MMIISNFLETLEFAKKVGFEKIHIFPYSKRDGTPAATFKNQISNKEKSSRVKRLGEEANNIRSEFFKKQIGKVLEVIIEEKQSDGYYFGYTANYTPVRISENKKNNDNKCLISSSDENYCYCE